METLNLYTDGGILPVIKPKETKDEPDKAQQPPAHLMIKLHQHLRYRLICMMSLWGCQCRLLMFMLTCILTHTELGLGATDPCIGPQGWANRCGTSVFCNVLSRKGSTKYFVDDLVFYRPTLYVKAQGFRLAHKADHSSIVICCVAELR
jgi:hypothetical protein